MGTSEFYTVVEDMNEILDSLVIDTGSGGEQGRLLLFLKLRPGTDLDEELRGRIKATLRAALAPRHTPDEIYAVPDVPKTLNDKKLEDPVKRIIAGEAEENVLNRDSIANPQALEFFVDLARNLGNR